MTQDDLFEKPYQPHFEGDDYNAHRDWMRLTLQIGRIWNCMRDGKWRTLHEISEITGDPEASVSAQLRHLRKERFGAHSIDKKYVNNGLYRYKMTVNPELLDACNEVLR